MLSLLLLVIALTIGPAIAAVGRVEDKGLLWKRVDPTAVVRFRVLWCTVVARYDGNHLFCTAVRQGEWAGYRFADSPQNAPGVAPSEVGRSATRRERSRAVLPRLPSRRSVGRIGTEPARCVSRQLGSSAPSRRRSPVSPARLAISVSTFDTPVPLFLKSHRHSLFVDRGRPIYAHIVYATLPGVYERLCNRLPRDTITVC